MDPNACLQRILDAAGDDDWEECTLACLDLTVWLRNGGMMPTVTPYNLEKLLFRLGFFATKEIIRLERLNDGSFN